MAISGKAVEALLKNLPKAPNMTAQEIKKFEKFVDRQVQALAKTNKSASVKVIKAGTVKSKTPKPPTLPKRGAIAKPGRVSENVKVIPGGKYKSGTVIPKLTDVMGPTKQAIREGATPRNIAAKVKTIKNTPLPKTGR